MRKFILIMLCFAILLSFAGCNGDASSKTDGSRARKDDEPEIRFEEPDSRPDNEKQELLDQYGTPFYIRRTFDMQLIIFTFDETSVLREHMDSMKDGTETHNASWEIVDGELVITGEWSETFTLDLEANTATSQTDGEIYRIVMDE